MPSLNASLLNKNELLQNELNKMHDATVFPCTTEDSRGREYGNSLENVDEFMY